MNHVTRWHKPPTNWVKLNNDAAIFHGTNKVETMSIREALTWVKTLSQN